MNNLPSPLPLGQICFGMDRAGDEASLAALIQRFSQQQLLETLIPRLSDREINEVLDFFTALMHKHLKDDEYHRLFIGDR